MDEQKVALLHEFIHLINIEAGLDRFRSVSEPRGREHYLIEEKIDDCAYHLLAEFGELVESLIRELSTRSNCQVIYEVPEETPFYDFHKQVIHQALIWLAAEPLQFGSIAQIKVLHWAGAMNISLS